MREEARLLKNHADPAPAGGDVDAFGGIEEDALVQHDTARFGSPQPGDHAHDRRFARPGPAEERRHAVLDRKRRVEREIAAPVRDLDGKAQAAVRARRARRASSSEASSAPSAITMETTLSRSAPASPPGTCR